MSRPASGCEPLLPLFEAFRRGTKRARLRSLNVVCPQGHSLLEVFPTSAGPVALWSRRERYTVEGQLHERWSEVWEAAVLSNMLDLMLPAVAACSCHDNVDVDLEWVQRKLNSGTVRVVAPALVTQRRDDVGGIVWE